MVPEWWGRMVRPFFIPSGSERVVVFRARAGVSPAPLPENDNYTRLNDTILFRDCHYIVSFLL